MAAVLQERVDVDLLLRERARDSGDDPRLVGDDKAKVVRCVHVAGHSVFLNRKAHGRASVRNRQNIAHNATAVGCPPAPWPLNTTSPPKSPLVTIMF